MNRRQWLIALPLLCVIVHMAQRVESEWRQAHSHYRNAIGGRCNLLTDPEKKLALDMEFKVVSLGNSHRLLSRQVREFSGH
jgi:hypothetical protein